MALSSYDLLTFQVSIEAKVKDFMEPDPLLQLAIFPSQ